MSGTIQLQEIFMFKRPGILSGQAVVYLYLQLSGKMKKSDIDTFIESRIHNLSLIKQFLSDEHHLTTQKLFDREQENIGLIADERVSTSYVNLCAMIHSSVDLDISIDEQINRPLIQPLYIFNNDRKNRLSKGRILPQEEEEINIKSEVVYSRQRKLKDMDPVFQLVNKLIEEDETVGWMKRRTYEDRYDGYMRHEKGGVECQNKTHLKCQEGVITEIISLAGRSLMMGRPLITISLPVRIFEPRSIIERVTDTFAFGPIYLQRAFTHKNNPVERLKNIAVFILSGLHTNFKQLKPFMPRLGGTLEGSFADGTRIYMEHTSFHPPVTHFFIEGAGKSYTYSGYCHYKMKINGNSFINICLGTHTLIFKDGDEFQFTYPSTIVSGLLYGPRLIRCVGEVLIKSMANNLECSIDFYEGGGWFGKDEHDLDHVAMEIRDTLDKKKILSKGEGSYLTSLAWEGQTYWDLSLIDPIKFYIKEDSLESTHTTRPDIILLSERKLVEAQKAKEANEASERKDREARTAHGLKGMK